MAQEPTQYKVPFLRKRWLWLCQAGRLQNRILPKHCFCLGFSCSVSPNNMQEQVLMDRLVTDRAEPSCVLALWFWLFSTSPTTIWYYLDGHGMSRPLQNKRPGVMQVLREQCKEHAPRKKHACFKRKSTWKNYQTFSICSYILKPQTLKKSNRVGMNTQLGRPFN